jgi:hypothetical protein
MYIIPIICDPRNAPAYAWQLESRLSGLKYWLKLLRPPMIGRRRWLKFPWCGWEDFWNARPWIFGWGRM